jgi:hypothetical protein
VSDYSEVKNGSAGRFRFNKTNSSFQAKLKVCKGLLYYSSKGEDISGIVDHVGGNVETTEEATTEQLRFRILLDFASKLGGSL